jgi:hypothetical protein
MIKTPHTNVTIFDREEHKILKNISKPYEKSRIKDYFEKFT